METEESASLVGEWQKVETKEDQALRQEAQAQQKRLEVLESSVKNIELLLTGQVQALSAQSQASGSKPMTTVKETPPAQAGVGK